MENNSLNIGIISTASIAHRFAEAAKDAANANALAISSRDLGKAQHFANQHNLTKAYDDYHELLNDPEIDVVYIPLVNSLHYPFAKEALLANKHVLLEKPFTIRKYEAEELRDIAKERNLFLTETVKTVFLPVFKDIKEIVDNKTYGEIQFMEFKQSYVSGEYIDGWNKQREFGGGVLYGNEAYFFTTAEFLAGNIQKVCGLSSFGQHDVEDQMSLSIKLENNSLATNCVSTNILFKNGLIMYLDKARIEIPDYWKARKAFIYQGDSLVQTIDYPCEHELVYEIEHYVDCIQKGLTESPVTPLNKTIKYIGICERIKERWENT